MSRSIAFAIIAAVLLTAISVLAQFPQHLDTANIESVFSKAQTPRADPVSDLLALDVYWQQAVVSGDAEFIERRTANDFVFTHWRETKGETKADWLRQAALVPRRFLKRRVSNQSVELHANLALIFGRLDVRAAGHANAAPHCYALEYVHLYALRDGEWIFLSHHTTLMLQAPHSCPD